MNLEYDDAKHEYRLNGRRVPSVTQVLKLAGIIDDSWYTSDACTRGTYVAQATEWYDRGELDEASLDPALRPYLDAWDKFLVDTRCEVYAIEERVCNEVYCYAGTLDRRIKIGDAEYIIDIKTGSEERWHPLQTSAYARCFHDRHLFRASVYLKDDGTYTRRNHTDCTDGAIFMAAAAVANWKLNHGGKL